MKQIAQPLRSPTDVTVDPTNGPSYFRADVGPAYWREICRSLFLADPWDFISRGAVSGTHKKITEVGSIFAHAAEHAVSSDRILNRHDLIQYYIDEECAKYAISSDVSNNGEFQEGAVVRHNRMLTTALEAMEAFGLFIAVGRGLYKLTDKGVTTYHGLYSAHVSLSLTATNPDAPVWMNSFPVSVIHISGHFSAGGRYLQDK